MKKAILFGSGNYARQKLDTIKKTYQIVGCVDNAVKPGNLEEFFGIEKRHPSEIAQFDSDAYIILLSFKWMEMYEQIMNYQINETRIVFGMSIAPYLDIVERLFFERTIGITATQKRIRVKVEDKEYWCADKQSFDKIVRALLYDESDFVNHFMEMPLEPISRRFGSEFGTPIDRVYIERFIREQSQYIRGTVMEIAEDKYARAYQSQISEMQILHVNGWGGKVIKGNFATGEGIVPNSIDCLICTQTLLFIYDLKNSIKNIYALLKEGGTALITVPGITQVSLYDYRNWGQYWSFTELSLRKLLQQFFADEKIEIKVYGNVKTAVGFLYGVCAETLSDSDFAYDDIQYQVIMGARVIK